MEMEEVMLLLAQISLRSNAALRNGVHKPVLVREPESALNLDSTGFLTRSLAYVMLLKVLYTLRRINWLDHCIEPEDCLNMPFRQNHALIFC